MTLDFTIPGPPRPKERPRTSAFDEHGRVRRNPRTGKPRPVTYTPKRTREYEAHVALCALQAKGAWSRRQSDERAWPLDARYMVGFDVYQRRDKPDRHNVKGAIFDACIGILWRDDSARYVVGDLAGRTVVGTEEPERVVVRVDIVP